jgi:fructokinase
VTQPNVGAIEAGGTKFVCAVGASWREVQESEKLVIPTTTPAETMARVLDWLDERHHEAPLAAIGVASFGPLDLATKRIAESTPKLPWRGLDWQGVIQERFANMPVALDTDTNAAGLAEWRWGAGAARSVSVYVTVGTGIGGGVILDGRALHGLLHPEIGHMFIPRDPSDSFAGVCPSHGDCLEGLACGPAIAERWGSDDPLPSDHPAWALEATYLAEAVVNLTAVASPEVIVLGGGVMSAAGLLENVRRITRAKFNNYFVSELLTNNIAEYIVEPSLGSNSGVLGAFALASDLIT